MKDPELTQKIKEWLDTEPAKRDLDAGAEMLLRVTRNRILYANITRNPKAKAAHLEYQLQKVLKNRLLEVTHEQVQQMMKEAAAAAVAEAMKNLPPQQPQVVQVMADTEKVVLRWMAPVADDNVAVFGANGMYGQVTGKNGTVIVPKGEWSRFYDETMRRFIDRRWLVVLSGMTDEERMLYHCDYRKGEIMDEKGFANIFRMGEELLPYFDALCTEHQEMVARSFCEAAEKGELDGDWRPLVKKLNAMNKKRYKDAPENDIRRKGMFRPVLDALNSAEDED